MRLEQLLSGAPNNYDHVVSAGQLGSKTFTVYASGARLLFLDDEQTLLQTVERPANPREIVAVQCCNADGRLAVSHGNEVVIYKPVVQMPDSADMEAKSLISEDFGSKGESWTISWREVASFRATAEDEVLALAWDPQGGRLLMGGSSISLWCDKALSDASVVEIAEARVSVHAVKGNYVPVWNKTLSDPVHHCLYSPDSSMFVTAGKYDRLPKLWYALDDMGDAPEDANYDFLYLPHPRCVTAMSWRPKQKHEPNVLLTSCGDNICRLWAETPSYEPFSVYCAASIAGELQALQSADGTVAPFVLHWLNTQELYEASPGPVVKETTPVPPGAERDLVGLNLAPDRTESSTSHRALRRIHSQNDMAFSEKASAHGHKGERMPRRSMVPGKISALPQSPPTVPEPPIAPSNPASAMARHNPPQSLSDVRQLPPQRRLTDDAELTWPNLLFFVQPDGAIAFYRVRHLCSMPRRAPIITPLSRGPPAIPLSDAAAPCYTVIVQADRDALLASRHADMNDFTSPSESVAHVMGLSRNAPFAVSAEDRGHMLMHQSSLTGGTSGATSSFNFWTKRTLPVAVTLHHANGVLARWRIYFEEGSAFSSVAAVDCVARCTGHTQPMVWASHHPFQSCALSLAGGLGGEELALWRVNDPGMVAPHIGTKSPLHLLLRVHTAPAVATYHTSPAVAAQHYVPPTCAAWLPSPHMTAWICATREGLVCMALRSLTYERLANTSSLMSANKTLYSSVHCATLAEHALGRRIQFLHVHALARKSAPHPSEEFLVIGLTECSWHVWRLTCELGLGAENAAALALLSHGLVGVVPDVAVPECSESLALSWPANVKPCAMTSLNPPYSLASQTSFHQLPALLSVACSDGAIRTFAVSNCSKVEPVVRLNVLPGAEQLPADDPLVQALAAYQNQPEHCVFSIRALDASATGRLVCVYNCLHAPCADRLASRAYVWELASSGDSFRLEAAVELESAVEAVSWISNCSFSDLLVCATAVRLCTFTQPNTDTTGRWLEVDSADSPSSILSLSACASGSVVVHCSSGLAVFSKWDYTPLKPAARRALAQATRALNGGLFNSTSAAGDGGSSSGGSGGVVSGGTAGQPRVIQPWQSMLPNLFETAAAANGLLPQYHPKYVLHLLKRGQAGVLRCILHNLLVALRRTKPNAGSADEEEDSGESWYRRKEGGASSGAQIMRLPPNTAPCCVVPPVPLSDIQAAADAGASSGAGGGKPAAQPASAAAAPIDKSDLFAPSAGLSRRSRTAEVDPVAEVLAQGHRAFDNTAAAALARALRQVWVANLTAVEQQQLTLLVASFAEIVALQQSLDDAGARFFAVLRLLAAARDTPAQSSSTGSRFSSFTNNNSADAAAAASPPVRISPADCLWALQSDAQETLLSLLPQTTNAEGGGAGMSGGAIGGGSSSGPAGKPTPPAVDWATLSSTGFGYWVRSTETLRTYVDTVAKTQFQRSRDPLDAAVFYVMLGKTKLVAGLFKTVNDTRMATFFNNDFNEERWRTAALKNAYVLLSKQRFLHCLTFFLLGGDRAAACDVALRNLDDAQLALIICRTAPTEDDVSTLLSKFVRQTLLPMARERGDVCLAAIAHWWLREYVEAYDAVVESVTTAADAASTLPQGGDSLLDSGAGATAASTSAAVGALLVDAPAASVYALAHRLSQHTQIRNHRQLSVALFYRATYAYIQTGLPLLALQTLAELQQHLQSLQDAADKAEAEAAASVATSVAATPAAQPAMSQQDMINSGTFSFDAFGGFGDFDDFPPPEPPKPEAPTIAADNNSSSTPADATSSVKTLSEDTGSGPTPLAVVSALHEALVPQWRVALATFLATAQLRHLAVSEFRWETASVQIRGEVAAAIAAASNSDATNDAVVLPAPAAAASATTATPTTSTSTSSTTTTSTSSASQSDSLMARDAFYVLFQYARLHELPSARSHLAALLAPQRVPEVLNKLCFQLYAALLPEDGFDKGMSLPTVVLSGPQVRDVCNSVASMMDVVLRQVVLSNHAAELGVTSVMLLEWVIGLYMTQLQLAWYARDLPRLVALVRRPPNHALWEALFGVGVTGATKAAQRLAQPMGVDASRTRSLLDYLAQPVPDQSFTGVDSGADEAVIEIGDMEKDSCPLHEAWSYRWQLLELLLVELACLHVQRNLKAGGLDASELSRHSLQLYRMLCNLEHRVGRLQPLVLSRPVPTNFSNSHDSTASSYPASSLFKMRGLLEDSANPFVGLHARRLWRSLLADDKVQDLVEYYIYHGPSQLAELHVRSPGVFRSGGASAGSESPTATPKVLSLVPTSTSGTMTNGGGTSAASSPAPGNAAGRGSLRLHAPHHHSNQPPPAPSSGAARIGEPDNNGEASAGSAVSPQQHHRSLARRISGRLRATLGQTQHSNKDDEWVNVYTTPVETTSVALSSEWHRQRLALATSRGIFEIDALAAEEALAHASASSTTTPLYSAPATSDTLSMVSSQSVMEAGLLLQRPVHSTRQVAAHPKVPVYASAGGDDGVLMWDFGVPEPARRCTLTSGVTLGRTMALVFDIFGSKLACCDDSGTVALWHNSFGAPATQFRLMNADLKRQDSLCFISPSVLCFGGSGGSDGHDVEVWDTLLSNNRGAVRRFTVDDGGAHVKSLLYLPHKQLLLCGSNKGNAAVLDMRMGRTLKNLSLHDGSVRHMLLCSDGEHIASAGGNGTVRLWRLNESPEAGVVWHNVHAKGRLFQSHTAELATAGTMLYSTGADGCLRRCDIGPYLG